MEQFFILQGGYEDEWLVFSEEVEEWHAVFETEKDAEDFILSGKALEDIEQFGRK